MKKFLVSLFALILLISGCSKSSSDRALVCEFDEDTMGIPMSVEITEADGKIGKLIYTVTYSGVLVGKSDSEIKNQKAELEKQMNNSFDDNEAVSIKVEDADDDMIMSATIDIQNAKTLPADFNVTGSTLEQMKSIKFSEMEKELKAEDMMKCEAK